MKQISLAVLLAFTSFVAAALGEDENFRNAFGPLFNGAQPAPPLPFPHVAGDAIHRWNQIAIDATGLDHTPVAPGDPRIFGEQLGPGRASRAMAIIHIAIFDTLNAIDRDTTAIPECNRAIIRLSQDVAVSQARTIRWWHSIRRRPQASTPVWPKTWRRVRNPVKERTALIWASAWPLPFSRMRQGDGSETPEPRVGVDYFTSDLARPLASGPDQPDSARFGRALGRVPASSCCNRLTSFAVLLRRQ